jgi:hypothetical protein
MEWMLPGLGAIQGIDMSKMRQKAYKKILKTKVDKTTPIYRFKKRSAKKFYIEFYYIAELMYYSRRLPYYHREVVNAEKRFDKLPLSGVMPPKKPNSLPSDKIKESPARQRLRARRKRIDKKPDTYKFSDSHVSKYDQRIQSIYAGKEINKPGRGTGTGRLKKLKNKKSKKKKKWGWFGRKLNNDSKQGKSDESKNQTGNDQNEGYADVPMQEIKVKRRKKRVAKPAQKSLKYKSKVDLRTGKHRRRLSKKAIRRHHNRKLKDLKGKIAEQWNNVFGQKLPHPNQAFAPQPSQSPQSKILNFKK